MKRWGSAVLSVVLLSGAYGPEIRYFSNVRDVSVSKPDKQNYLVIDEEIWEHARPDLADIRFYDGVMQVPYVLHEQKRTSTTVERPAKILNLGRVGDHTEFDLEMLGVQQYDRIRLQVDAKDFVATALLFGGNTLERSTTTQLGPSTLYDFSREKLGSNFVLQLPPSSFPYLHVQLTAGIRPDQVKAAGVFDVQEKQANWITVGNCSTPVQDGRNTTASCRVPVGVPLDRIQFVIPAEQVNFRRNVTVNAGENQAANGEISRVRMTRAGTQVVSEQMSVDLPDFRNMRETKGGEIKVIIANGDDPPLSLLSVQPLALERRVYFDPGGRLVLKMYYGDPQLQAPVYDYAKFFQEESDAAQAQLGRAMHNAEYAGRPDERPWSERHKAVLWATMLLAVAAFAILAVRGLANPKSLS
jgi:hypothetical protein